MTTCLRARADAQSASAARAPCGAATPLGAIGIGAAIANAVFHATGARVREFPVRPEQLLG